MTVCTMWDMLPSTTKRMTPRAIRAALRQKGWTINRLAEECKEVCGRMTVYRFVAGESGTVRAIAERIEAILTGGGK